MPPNLAPQQVPGEDIWRLQNVRKRFTGRGSATDPLEKLTALPSPLSWWARRLAVPSPRTPLPLSAILASGFGPLGLAPDPK